MTIERLRELLDELETACVNQGGSWASDEDAQRAKTARAAIEAEFVRLMKLTQPQ